MLNFRKSQQQEEQEQETCTKLNRPPLREGPNLQEQQTELWFTSALVRPLP